MRRMGVKIEELTDVKEVIIRTSRFEYRFSNPKVSIMDVKGEKIYQIMGSPEVKEIEVEVEISEEDISLLIEQTGCTREEAIEALKKSKGDLAEAVLLLQPEG